MKRIIVKFGTESLLDNNKIALSQSKFNQIASQIAAVKKLDCNVLIVSSGAIQAGRENCKTINIDTNHLHKKDIAGIGANILLNFWSKAFSRFGLATAQVWVTHGNLNNYIERKSIVSSLNNYQKAGVIPIINENDVVSAREIVSMEQNISENDQITRLIAEELSVDLVIFITSIGGVYEEDPNINSKARMYKELNSKNLPRKILGIKSESKSGTGGMGKKIIEASKCFNGKNRVVISGADNNSIIRIAEGREIGTKLALQNKFY